MENKQQQNDNEKKELKLYVDTIRHIEKVAEGTNDKIQSLVLSQSTLKRILYLNLKQSIPKQESYKSESCQVPSYLEHNVYLENEMADGAIVGITNTGMLIR